MTDRSIVYTGSTGEAVEMAVGGPWHYGDTDLHDYEWSYDTVNDRSVGFRRSPRDFSIHVMLRGGDAAERDRAVDVFDADVAAGTPGTLRVGASEMRCYVTASSKDRWWYDEASMDMDLTVHADDPVWTREATSQFLKAVEQEPSDDLDYPHGYPHDYAPDTRSAALSSPFASPCAARITVYGPAVNPYVIIAGNRYQVDATVEDGGLLVIDGRGKTITVTSADGYSESAFAAGVREDGARVFAPVPSGTSPVSWTGAFGFDVTLIEERSEPAWT